MNAISTFIETRVRTGEFEPSRYAHGQKHSLLLDLSPYAPGVELAVLLIRGATEGKTLVVTAGVHGDEFEGVRAILEVCADLDLAPVPSTKVIWLAHSRGSSMDVLLKSLHFISGSRSSRTPTFISIFTVRA